jgi:hypothetical protein
MPSLSKKAFIQGYFEKDEVSQKIFRAYMAHLLQNRGNSEIFYSRLGIDFVYMTQFKEFEIYL